MPGSIKFFRKKRKDATSNGGNTVVVGSRIVQDTSNSSVAYPSGTQPGDLIVVLTHYWSNITASNFPTGFTLAGTSGPSPYNDYRFNIAYKICGSEKTFTNPYSSNLFDVCVIALRGPTRISSTIGYSTARNPDNPSSGFTLAEAGTRIVYLSDRGASSALPSLSVTPDHGSTGQTVHFWARLGVYTNKSGPTFYGFTDVYNGHETNALFLTAI